MRGSPGDRGIRQQVSRCAGGSKASHTPAFFVFAQAARTHPIPRPDSPQDCEAGLNVEHRVVEGDPVKQILGVAQETGCDLLVMGTRGVTGLSRWFTTSVAEEVVRQAPCSVLVSKLDKPAA